ncbi:MAG: hypothetical protein QM606_04510 [Leucobacter sp.]
MSGDRTARDRGDADRPASDRPHLDAAPRTRRPRRASLPAPAGSDPDPYDPPQAPRTEGENDARLLGDRPPHWR